MSRDAEAWERMLETMRVVFRTMPETSPGAYVLELDGVFGTVTPAVPERSLPNSVVYTTEEALDAALPTLVETYDREGIDAWTVWTPEYHSQARRLLEEAGHKLDAAPTAMIAELSQIEEPAASDPEPAPDPTWDELGEVNDLAYGTGDSFARLLGSGPADPRFVYLARDDDGVAASVVSQDRDGDCSIWWVATRPDARGRGLAPGLMRRALADGRARGCEVSTLQATKLGRPVYDRLGYRSLGTIEMWERRRGAPPPTS